MATDSAVTYVESIQHRARKLALIGGLLLVLLLTPLIVSPDLRLDLAWRFGWVAGPGVEQVAAGGDRLLIIVPVEATAYGSRAEIRYEATFLAEPYDTAQRLTNLATDQIIDVPATTLDFIAADPSGRYLFIVSGSGASALRLLVDVDANTVESLPEGAIEPDIPGNWDRSIWATRIGRTCSGVSPMQTYLFCFRAPTLATYLAGDWQLDVQKYGQYQQQREIFRGAGTQPVAGFTADDAWLYFQNENGIWREPMTDNMFDS